VKKKRLLILLAAVLSAVGLAAYMLQPGAEPLRMAVIPSNDPAEMRATWQPILEYLEAGLGQPVELSIVPDYTAVVEALKYGHVDVARIGATGYVQAVNQGVETEILAAGIKCNTGAPGYYAYIVARADSGLKTLDDLNGQGFAFVDVGSTTGYVIPTMMLEQGDIETGEMFMAGSHLAVILAVQNGSVAAGAVASNRYDAALAEGVIADGELAIIFSSALVPTPPIVALQSLDESLRQQLKTLLLNMPVELSQNVEGLGECGYAEVSDSDYDIIRQLMAR
jgi:phosphonate transport system substrate-binding protein